MPSDEQDCECVGCLTCSDEVSCHVDCRGHSDAGRAVPEDELEVTVSVDAPRGIEVTLPPASR